MIFAPVGIPVEKMHTAVVASPDQQRHQGTTVEYKSYVQEWLVKTHNHGGRCASGCM
jgi:hypothetical protein